MKDMVRDAAICQVALLYHLTSYLTSHLFSHLFSFWATGKLAWNAV